MNSIDIEYKKNRMLASLKNASIIVFMVLLGIFLGNGLNLIGWGYIVQIRYYFLIACVCWTFYALLFIQYRERYITFKYYTLFLTIWPFTTLFISYLLGGNIEEELVQVQVWVFVSTFFLFFHHFNLSENIVLSVLITIATITAVIQIEQQINPTFAIFGGSPDDVSEVVSTGERNGIIRYFVGSYQIQMFAMCYCWCKMLKTFRPIWFFLSALMIVSIYLYVTKQLLITTLLTLGITLLFVKGRKVRSFSFVLLCLSVFSLVLFWDNLFGELIQDSKDDSFSHAIRFEFINYITNYNLYNPVLSILGHGTTIPFFEELRLKLYYPSDIGFIGEAIYYGWLWAAAYIYIAFRLFITYRNRIPLYIRMYVFCSGIISVFIFPYRDRIELFNWMCVIYISSLYIDRKTLKDNY